MDLLGYEEEEEQKSRDHGQAESQIQLCWRPNYWGPSGSKSGGKESRWVSSCLQEQYEEHSCKPSLCEEGQWETHQTPLWIQSKKVVCRKWDLAWITTGQHKKLWEAKTTSLLQGYKVTKTTLETSKSRMCINHIIRKKDFTCLTLSLDYFFCCSGIFTELIFYLLWSLPFFKNEHFLLYCYACLGVMGQTYRKMKGRIQKWKKGGKPGFLVENTVQIKVS